MAWKCHPWQLLLQPWLPGGAPAGAAPSGCPASGTGPALDSAEHRPVADVHPCHKPSCCHHKGDAQPYRSHVLNSSHDATESQAAGAIAVLTRQKSDRVPAWASWALHTQHSRWSRAALSLYCWHRSARRCSQAAAAPVGRISTAKSSRSYAGMRLEDAASPSAPGMHCSSSLKAHQKITTRSL